MGSLESILAKQERERIVYTFTIPESIKGDVRTIGLVELTADEEIAIEARCKGAGERRAVEIVKATVWEVNGARIHNLSVPKVTLRVVAFVEVAGIAPRV